MTREGKNIFTQKERFLTEKTEHFLLCRKEEQILFSLTLQFFSTFSRDYLLLQPVALPIALPSSVSMPLTLLRCVDLRFNILCAVELLDSISDIYIYIYFFCRRIFGRFFVILAFSGLNFCYIYNFTRTFFSSSVLFTNVVVVLPSHYDNKVRSSSSLFTDLCSQDQTSEGFVVNVLVFKCLQNNYTLKNVKESHFDVSVFMNI